MFPNLINLMPPHRVYIEPFLGGGSVMRHKRPAQVSVGVDLDARPLARFSNYPASYTFMRADAVDALVSLQPGADALVYCDPPYLPSCRRSPRSPYRHSLDQAGHERLLTCLRQLPCAVMISTYPCELYERVLSDWHQVTFQGTSHVGRRVEVVWLNFVPGGLLHDTRFLGEDFRQREVIRRRQRRLADHLRKLPDPELQIALADATNEFTARFGAEHFEQWRRTFSERECTQHNEPSSASRKRVSHETPNRLCP